MTLNSFPEPTTLHFGSDVRTSTIGNGRVTFNSLWLLGCQLDTSVYVDLCLRTPKRDTLREREDHYHFLSWWVPSPPVIRDRKWTGIPTVLVVRVGNVLRDDGSRTDRTPASLLSLYPKTFSGDLVSVWLPFPNSRATRSLYESEVKSDSLLRMTRFMWTGTLHSVCAPSVFQYFSSSRNQTTWISE